MRLRFPEEDDARPGAPEGLVDGGGDHVAVLERRRGQPGGHEARHVGHVGHQERAWGWGDQILNFLPNLAAAGNSNFKKLRHRWCRRSGGIVRSRGGGSSS